LSRVFRVLRKQYARNAFDGEGAYLFGGRWTTPGTRLSYTSEHQSLAMLEYFVHLDDPPTDLVLAIAEVPEDLSRERVATGDLPSNCRSSPAPPQLAAIGDEFARERKNCLLFVPSILAPQENNCLLNPEHADFKKISMVEIEPLSYDSRRIGERQRHGKRRN